MEYYASANALGHSSMLAYCDKVMAKCKTRPHCQKQHRQDPEMVQYKILEDARETETQGSRHDMSVETAGVVGEGEKADVIKHFASKKRKEGADDPMPVKQKSKTFTKMPVEEMRTKKVAADLEVAASTLKDLRLKQISYTEDLQTNIEAASEKLVVMSSDFHVASLKGNKDAAGSLWLRMVEVMKELKNDLDVAISRLHFGLASVAKPHFTPYDPCLDPAYS